MLLPRICRYPLSVTSAAEDTIDLAASYGLNLDPWQRFDLQHALGEDENHLWTAFEVALIVARQNGKGAIIEARELAGFELFDERYIIHTAHEVKTAMEAMDRMESLIAANDELSRLVKKIVRGNGKECIEFYNRDRRFRLSRTRKLRYLARSKSSGRGFANVSTIFFDEAFALTAEQKGAMVPTMSTAANPQIWYLSSPPLDPVSGHQLFRLRHRAEGKAGLGDVDDEDRGLVYLDYGMAGVLDEVDERSPDGVYLLNLDDPEKWAATNPAYGIRVSERYIRNEMAALDRVQFARERLGVWPRDLGDDFQIVSRPDWLAAEDPRALIVKNKVLSLDISRDRSRAAIGIAGRTREGRRGVEITGTEFEIDARNGTGWLIARILEITKRNTIAAVVVDAGSEAGTEIPALERAGVEVQRLSMQDVSRGWGIFYDAVSGKDVAARNLVHIGQPELTAAVAGALKRELAGGHAWDRKNGKVDITPLVAVTNALLGSEVYGHKEPVRPFAIWA